MMRSLLLAVCLASFASPLALAAESPAPPASKKKTKKQEATDVVAAPLEESAAAALKARGIGPAVMGGRVPEIALDPKDPYTFYVALGTGGLMKTNDNGGSFKGIFEDQPVAAIGAVAVAPSDPKVVWVGTGEANDRNSSSWGDGVYRSGDAGATWTRAGLADSKTIARIVVHPADPKTAWVAVMGDLWSPSPNRGLYKTTDGGATWKASLTASGSYTNRVGAGDVVIDPTNPDILYAALYARRRTPWSFVAGPEATEGKDLGGIFKTTDGGATWHKLSKGLPTGTGRIGLALFAKDPKIVYAVVQSDAGGTVGIDTVRSKAGGVFRSSDGGESWTRTSPLDPRPFYFSQIRVDPENDQRVYILGYALHVSEDGGHTFREDRFGKVHPDCHALAIDPRTPQRLLLGTDGGPYQSYNGGETWQQIDTIAAGEFYRIAVDDQTPYRICGGLQDNLNWVGPSRTFSKDGIVNSDWTDISGGDGFYCTFDAENPNIVYAESQGGSLHRFDLATGQVKSLRPEPAEGQTAFRFHWNSPLIGSHHQKGTLYLGGNRVFKLTVRGEQWRAISPDLSAQDPLKTTTVGSGAENYGVVYALAESTLKPGLLWAGTDDGKLWTTETDGDDWTDLTPYLPAPVKGQWISRVEPSHHNANVAYLAVDAHRTGNYAPLAYRTADGGRTWQSVASDLPASGPVKVVREDLVNPDLLFAGTEFGLFATLDRGGHWFKLGGLPTVAVDDILVHPRDRDLVAATHGRSLYIIDYVRALQDLTADVRSRAAYLFAPRPAQARHLLPGWADSAGASGQFRGANPPEGAILDVWVKEYSNDPVKIAITTASGVPVANLTTPAVPGLSRVTWDLKLGKDMQTEYGGEGAALFVRAGEYTVTLTHGKIKMEQKLRVDVAPGVETR
jgi:photosystem II stability/assembly factor-like uncharacterized protein